MRFKENWWRFTDSQVGDFLRTGTEGKGHPSRLAVVRLLEGMTSVLDAGCGTGVMFELLKETRPEIDYVGVDVTQKFVDAARARFPADAARFRCQSFLTLSELGRPFDAVICRHVLEHLPDYVPSVQQLYDCVVRKLIIVFYLPPVPLRWGRRKRDQHFDKGFYTHTYDLGAFMDYLMNKLSPLPSEIRVHARQGHSDSRVKWADRENVIYEILRPQPGRG
jgi:SAM-dependent methyltransferase